MVGSGGTDGGHCRAKEHANGEVRVEASGKHRRAKHRQDEKSKGDQRANSGNGDTDDGTIEQSDEQIPNTGP